MMTRHNLQKQAGTSLIETLIYIGLFVIVIGGVMLAAYQTIELTTHSQTKVVLEGEGNFLLRKIDWAVMGVDNIIVSDPITFTVIKNGLPLIFHLDNGNLTLKRGSDDSKNLNSDAVTVTGLTFTYFPPAGNKPAALKTIFTLNFFNQSKIFETTKYLRI